MEVWIDSDEWYPVYTLSLTKGYMKEEPFDIDNALAERILKAQEEFGAVQYILRELVEKVKP